MYHGKNCVITGGSSGLGKAVAEHLLCHGANVTIVARKKDQLSQAEGDLQKYLSHDEQKLLTKSVDVTDYNNVQSAMKEIFDEMGSIQYLFCCAGKIFVIPIEY